LQESNDSSYVQTPPLVGLESLKVCDIIDQSTGNWNVNAINEIFNNRDAQQQILSMATYLNNDEDTLIWKACLAGMANFQSTVIII